MQVKTVKHISLTELAFDLKRMEEHYSSLLYVFFFDSCLSHIFDQNNQEYNTNMNHNSEALCLLIHTSSK
jgi:hypothetical protein